MGCKNPLPLRENYILNSISQYIFMPLIHFSYGLYLTFPNICLHLEEGQKSTLISIAKLIKVLDIDLDNGHDGFGKHAFVHGFIHIQQLLSGLMVLKCII
jgi:hypothetical protein